MRIDHVILACPGGLDAGADLLLRRYGLRTATGGQHPAFGTANRVSPLERGAYLELAGVVDEEAAGHAAFGRLLAAAARGARHPVPAAWCVAVDDVGAHARRLGLPVAEGSRVRPDGVVLRWRTAGIEEALERPALPFLIEWDLPAGGHPSAASLGDHPAEPAVRLVELRLSGDPRTLHGWLDGGLDDATVVVRSGRPAVLAFVLEVGERTVVLSR